MFTNEQVRTAVKWWVDHINPATHNTGDGLQDITAAVMGVQKDITSEQREKFSRELEYEIRADEGALRGRVVVATDYGPGPLLQNAAKRVGIEIYSTTFPMKTCMILYDDNVVVGHGYGAPFETIWERQRT